MPSKYQPLQDSDYLDQIPSSSSSKSGKRDRHVTFVIDDEEDQDGSHMAGYADVGREEYRTSNLDLSQGIAPPLKSTVKSREAEFDLDSDELPDEHYIPSPDTSTLREESEVPLMVGLMHSASRRSLDIPLAPMNGRGGPHSSQEMLEHIQGTEGNGGMLESIVNMANSILGAGIIGLPYAIREAGFFFGIILLVVLCGVTDWTIRLIVVNAKLSGRNSYMGVMEQTFGQTGRAAISFFQFAFAFGGMCAFGIIIGDTIPHVIRAAFPRIQDIPIISLFGNRTFIVVLCTTCVSYPLSLHRDISKLARASGLALIGMLIIVISVVIEGGHVSSELKGDPKDRFSVVGSQVFEAIGVISFAFVCHHNSLLIYGSLNTPTLDRFSRVTHASTALSLVFCLLLGLSGYVVFTNKTQGNILNNFSSDDTLINVARFCFGLNMFTTLPLELFVCREVIEQYFYEHQPFVYRRHFIITTVILFASMLVSLVTCDLGVMLEITGGVSATALAYIFPSLCFIKLSRDTPWRSHKKMGAVACTIFGVVVLTLSVWLTLAKAWSGDSGAAKVCT